MMRNKVLTITALLLIVSMLVPAAVWAAGAAGLRQAALPAPAKVDQIGGVTNSVIFSGGQLFYNIGSRIVRMAVSAATPDKPVKPEVFGGILPGVPQDIKAANGYLYVALGSNGLAVVDQSSLAVVATVPMTHGEYATSVGVSANALYVAAGSDGVLVYNLGANKKTLTYLQTKTFTSPSRTVTDVETATIGAQQLVFVSANDYAAEPDNHGGVLKFDVTGAPNLGNPVAVNDDIDVNALAVAGSYVYAAGESHFYLMDTALLGGPSGVLSILDVNEPALEIVAGPAGSVFLLNATGIEVVNVSTPATPVLETASPFAVPDGTVNELAAADYSGTTYLYLANSNLGLGIVSVAQATPDTLVLNSASYGSAHPGASYSVASVNQQAFIFSQPAFLWTANSTNPAALSLSGSGLSLDMTINSLTGYSGGVLISAGTDGLLRYKTNAGTDPSSNGAFDTDGIAYAAAVSGSNAFVADGENGLAVVNIDGAMTLTGSAPAPDSDSDFRLIDVQGQYAYVYDANGTFRIYDVSNPAAPVAKGTLHQEGVLDLKVKGNFAFLASGEAGVTVVDISNPNAPAQASVYNTPDLAISLVVYMNHVVVADWGGGVLMLAIKPNGQLELVNSLPTSGAAVHLTQGTGKYIYVAEENGGVSTLQMPMSENKIFIPAILH